MAAAARASMPRWTSGWVGEYRSVAAQGRREPPDQVLGLFRPSSFVRLASDLLQHADRPSVPASSNAVPAVSLPMRVSASTLCSFTARSFLRPRNARRRASGDERGAPPSSLPDCSERRHRLEDDLVILPERLAFADDVHEHRHDAGVAVRDERVDDGAPQRRRWPPAAPCGWRGPPPDRRWRRARTRLRARRAGRACRSSGCSSGTASGEPRCGRAAARRVALHEPARVAHQRGQRVTDGLRAEADDHLLRPSSTRAVCSSAMQHRLQRFDGRHADRRRSRSRSPASRPRRHRPMSPAVSRIASDSPRRSSACRQASRPMPPAVLRPFRRVAWVTRRASS